MGKRNFDAESREYRILNANSYNTFLLYHAVIFTVYAVVEKVTWAFELNNLWDIRGKPARPDKWHIQGNTVHQLTDVRLH